MAETLINRARNRYTAACIRAARTGIQTILAGIGTSELITAVDWEAIVATAGLATLVSLLQGVLTALPEVDGDA